MDRYNYTDEVRAVLEGLQQPLAVYQLIDNRIVTILVSDGFCRLLGYAERSRAIRDMDHNMYRDAHPDDIPKITQAALRFAEGAGAYDVVFRTRAGVDSDYRVIHAHGKHVYTDTGLRLAHVWYMDEGVYIEGNETAGTPMNREVNSALHEESLLRAASYDPLTGLPNMAYFFKLCEQGKARLYGRGKHGCLLYIDLNGMKFYNHRYGYAEGDRLLKAFAGELAAVFGVEDCCHVGADRFAVSTEEEGAEARVKQLFEAVGRLKNRLPVRVGIYSTRLEDVPISAAYDRAKMACDSVPKTERSAYRHYTREMSDADKRRRYIQSGLGRAIAGGWIQVYYQPIVRAVNGRVCNEEALARWIDPEMGFLSPAEFIPYLEEAGELYRLDLHILEQVLKKILRQKADGLEVVPHSVNLSRSDFDSCDMVEEIRRRVEASGVPRRLVTIEITESTVGRDFEFMKRQIARFRELGFAVWMDDFGSGYSSLDVLQSIQFDLIKFDMSFMRRLDEGDSARIVLTELMKMAASINADTVCEGVETEAQIRFAQEIGCSKLQGFYYSRPVPYEEILERHRRGIEPGYENPDESDYYETIGRLNLYDFEGIARKTADAELQNAFNTLPMAILEVRNDRVRFVRASQSYRRFTAKHWGSDTDDRELTLKSTRTGFGEEFVRRIRQCCGDADHAFFDEILPDGSTAHTFIRRLSVNPVTGGIAMGMAVLSVAESTEGTPVERMLSVFERFGERVPGGFFIFRADDSRALLYANRAVYDIYGCDGPEDFRALTGMRFRGMVHPEDYDRVSEAVRRHAETGQSGNEPEEFRILRRDGEVRRISGYGHYVETDRLHALHYVFISDITDRYEKAESDRAQRAAVIEALTRAYDSVWLIDDVETQRFELYRIDGETAHLIPANAAAKLERFSEAFAFYAGLVLEEDRQRFLEAVSPERIATGIRERPVYSVPFRRVFENGTRRYRVEFVRMDMPDARTRIVVGFRNVDEETRREGQSDGARLGAKGDRPE